MAMKKRGLGRGLEALLGDDPGGGAVAGELQQLPIHLVKPGPFQPRQHFDADKLDELADSIRAQGLIQPIVVRALADGGYELIAGERRWRAAGKAGLKQIPALVREVDDQTVVAMALIENIQRENLSPLEEAQALARLIDEFGLTHQQTADAVGRARASVSNLLRLLELPAAIKRLLDERRLEMGHARALINLPTGQAVELAHQAADGQWTVRELEAAARRVVREPASKPAPARDPDIAALERELAERLSTRVAVAHGRGGRGKLVIHYHSVDELDGILQRIR